MDIGEMQKKLSRWAEQDKTHRFYDLYHLLHNDVWLRAAQAHVRQNAGSRTAGCDGVNMRDFEENLERNLGSLREDLKSGDLKPDPVRRTYIRENKAGGRVKMRPLGIPGIRDRIVQEALRMILEPIWEADFSRHSYGFRPNRSTKDAVVYICTRLIGTMSQKYGWVVEGDIQSFFDTIDHGKLMVLLRRRIRDKKILALIWKFLRAGVMEQGNLRHSLLGTPQGGIISPLLANIYLDELDRYMARYTELSHYERRKRRNQGEANFLYVRYADDFVVLCDGTREQALVMRQELYEYLKSQLSLELSLEKTKVTHIHEGIEFLGFLIDRSITGSGKWAPRIRIPDRALEKVLEKVRIALDPRTHSDSLRAKIIGLNQIIGGWCRYYQVTSSPSRYFRKLRNEVYPLMAHWIGRKYQMSIKTVMRQFGREGSFGTSSVTLKMPDEYKGTWHRLRKIPNPYTSEGTNIIREDMDVLEDGWAGKETLKGQEDLKEMVYKRDVGLCGICGNFVPWEEADLDHKRPRLGQVNPQGSMGTSENVQIVHRDPCHRLKTKRDLQRESRVR